MTAEDIAKAVPGIDEAAREYGDVEALSHAR
jgi:hypothetical protein